MTGMLYNSDSFTRVAGGAVKAACPEAEVSTCGDSGYVTLGNGQVFRFMVEETTPEEASAALLAAGAIACPPCERTSWNPNDVREGYCGHCHDWTSPGKQVT